MQNKFYIGYWIKKNYEDYDAWNDKTMFLEEPSEPIFVTNSISNNKESTIDLVIKSILSSGYNPIIKPDQSSQFKKNYHDFYLWTFNIQVKELSAKEIKQLKNKLNQLI